MTACHEHWEADDLHHVCGRILDHDSWHLCVCGELLLTNVTRIESPARQVACPTCLAGPGSPCHTKLLSPMSGVHTERVEVWERSQKPSKEKKK